MIYSDDFVWLHFPRCGGTKITQIFLNYYSHDRQIFQDVVDPLDQNVSWHDSIADRENRDQDFSLGDRMIICSFRKLPEWLESRYSFEYHRSPYLNHQPGKLLEGKFLEQNGSVNYADRYAKKYFTEAILSSGTLRFLRTEFFESDFNLVFGEFIDVSIIPKLEFSDKVNSSISTVPIDIRRKLFEEEEVYVNCPYWKIVEDIAYG